MKKLVIVALLISFVIGSLSLSAVAEDKVQTAVAEDKVQRSTKNLALGWTEIPDAIAKVTKDTDNPFLGLTIGLLKGVANAFARTVSGAAEVITLPASRDTEPAIKDSMVEVTPGNTK